MHDVVALGELLIDFAPAGKNERGMPRYEANPGGAPGNVLVALQRLGCSTAFIGCVGKDEFGKLLVSALQREGVNTSGIAYSDIHTTLAFVHLDERGDRTFSFCRNPGADMMLTSRELPVDLIRSGRIFHFGSISMTDEPAKLATIEALRIARRCNVSISYDPNLRLPLWNSPDEARQTILAGVMFADIVKLSVEELAFLAGTSDPAAGVRQLVHNSEEKLIFVTSGEHGSHAFCGNRKAFVPGFRIEPVDTTGAGDAFFAGVLYRILQSGLDTRDLTEDGLTEMLRFGNAMGALAASSKGASLPCHHRKASGRSSAGNRKDRIEIKC